jgi:hypothetical protein
MNIKRYLPTIPGILGGWEWLGFNLGEWGSDQIICIFSIHYPWFLERQRAPPNTAQNCYGLECIGDEFLGHGIRVRRIGITLLVSFAPREAHCPRDNWRMFPMYVYIYIKFWTLIPYRLWDHNVQSWQIFFFTNAKFWRPKHHFLELIWIVGLHILASN